MCLALRTHSHLPYNKSRIRWKIVDTGERLHLDLRGNWYWKKHYCAPFRKTPYETKGWNTAELDTGRLDSDGFHVLVTRADARRHAEGAGRIVKRIRVSGFLRSGHWGVSSSGCKSETWKRFKFED